ncbi:MAG: hypothetical protein Kow0069_08370 [Promethearchaeota archaeon]
MNATSSFSQLVARFDTLSQVARDKGLAKIGDCFVNLTFSLALSLSTGTRTGEKVPKKVLAQAVRATNLRRYAPPRADAHALADAAEAILAYAWLAELVTLKEAVDELAAPLSSALKEHPEINPKSSSVARALANSPPQASGRPKSKPKPKTKSPRSLGGRGSIDNPLATSPASRAFANLLQLVKERLPIPFFEV